MPPRQLPRPWALNSIHQRNVLVVVRAGPPHSFFPRRAADFQLGRHAVGVLAAVQYAGLFALRSEERRVGKECSSRRWRTQQRKQATSWTAGANTPTGNADARY